MRKINQKHSYRTQSWFNRAVIIGLTLLLSSCVNFKDEDGPPAFTLKDLDNVPNAVPKDEPRSRYGNPDSYEVFGRTYYTKDSSDGHVEEGVGSWYGRKFHGRRTSSGEPYDMYAMTAAHPSLPLITYAKVTNLHNNRSVIVRITDRGPFHGNRVIDLSYAAAHKLDMVRTGTARVRVEAIDPYEYHNPVPVLAEQRMDDNKSHMPESQYIYLQVGAFSNPESSNQMANHLKKIGATPVKIQRTQRGSQTLHQVRVGPFTDPKAANQMAARLEQANLNTPLVVFDRG